MFETFFSSTMGRKVEEVRGEKDGQVVGEKVKDVRGERVGQVKVGKLGEE